MDNYDFQVLLKRLKVIRVLYFVELIIASFFLFFSFSSAILYNKDYLPFPSKLLGIIIGIFIVLLLFSMVISLVYNQLFNKIKLDKRIKCDKKYDKMQNLIKLGKWVPFLGIYNIFYYIRYIKKEVLKI